jgi:hypothetical protein
MIDYADEIKAARMRIVRDALAGGALELLEDGNVVARIGLNQAVLIGSVIEFATSDGTALTDAEPSAARMVGDSGSVVVRSLDIGTDVILDDDTIKAGQTVRILSAVLRHA